ncbi:MAG TPA: hypothetical protein PLT23_02260 [Lentisphaeria bacterium]|nr:hypothetical protein [Lentisphaerota bacterium]OQC12047.1 MAG: hypothetical protein BWX73_03206 [Lentisphaerae bacterium ADurb.Bin082]HPY89520.1 hypothetical protein [Lentisphaeria bacterium]HQL87173.1 hypothetical protein [Lentisphaeria bacterium]
MAKKSVSQRDDDLGEAAPDKKAKRKANKASKSQVSSVDDDTMSRVVEFCQELRWREAVLLCRTAQAKAEEEGREELAFSLSLALPKLEWSLRRQIAAAFIHEAKAMLKKEYLLDVGQ